MVTQTYAELWDKYVSEGFPRQQRTSDKTLSYPGEEWGSKDKWQAIFDRLLTFSKVEEWDCAIELGGGGGKYTERALAANRNLKLWGFDVSQNFLDATAARLRSYVSDNRLTLNLIDPTRPDSIYNVMLAAGCKRKVDAMFSIDAMVHVDLQYLVAYWITAGLLLKPGGSVLMTLADPTSALGFQKITRDIRKFYKMQGQMCPKFEYLSQDIVKNVLTRLGFEIELNEHWSEPGRLARDIYLIARLSSPESAERYAQFLSPTVTALAQSRDRHVANNFSELWDLESDRIRLGFEHASRQDVGAVFDRMFKRSNFNSWQNAIELGISDGRYTKKLLSENSDLKILGFDVSEKLLAAARDGLADYVEDGRLQLAKIDAVDPSFIFKIVEGLSLVGKVDAVFAIDTMVHVDTQYLIVYLIAASLVLKEGGQVIMNVADGASEEGFAKLVGDIPVFFPRQGRPCPRFEYQSPVMIRSILESIGFEIEILENWSSEHEHTGRDLFLIARLSDLRKGKQLGPHIGVHSTAWKTITNQPAAIAVRGGTRMVDPELSTEQDAARALGQAQWRVRFLEQNPGLSKEELKAKMKETWGGARREHVRIGFQMLRQLSNMGFQVLKKKEGSASDNQS